MVGIAVSPQGVFQFGGSGYVTAIAELMMLLANYSESVTTKNGILLAANESNKLREGYHAYTTITLARS